MKIGELQSGMKRVEIEASVVDKGAPRQVKARFGDEMFNVADAIVQDDSGSIKLTLWNEQRGGGGGKKKGGGVYKFLSFSYPFSPLKSPSSPSLSGFYLDTR